MPEIKYSITELEKLTGLNRRTIHFYTQQGLIPAPNGLGSTATYGELHYLRLKLIRHLQKTDLKLTGIKKILDPMGIEELRKYTAAIEKTPVSQVRTDALGKVSSYLKSPKMTTPLSYFDAISRSAVSEINFSIANRSEKMTLESKETMEPLWHRFAISNAFEFTVRDDVYKTNKEIIDVYIEILKDAIKEGR